MDLCEFDARLVSEQATVRLQRYRKTLTQKTKNQETKGKKKKRKKKRQAHVDFFNLLDIIKSKFSPFKINQFWSPVLKSTVECAMSIKYL